MLSNKEVLEQAVKNYVENHAERTEKREEFIRENTLIWLEQGKELKTRREEHGMSLRSVAERLGTSATRISKLEKGEPVSMAEQLAKSYNLLFDYIDLRKKFQSFFFDSGLNRRA